jgi:hypothetical protein
VYLDADDLGAAARSLGIPWRPSDPRSRFRQAVEDASDGGDVGALLVALRPAVERWRAFHAERETSRTGDVRTWRAWRLRAEGTLDLLDRADDGADALVGDDDVRDILAHAERALRRFDGALADRARRTLTDLIEEEPS